MEKIRFNYLKSILFLLVIITSINCERDLTEDAIDATFSKTGEVFTDAPVGMGSNFYFPYSGSKATAWSVDSQVSYKGTSSMRFDVPNADDSEGNYAGGIFRIDGAGRDLSDYDALTFWAKASQGVSIDQIGFGEDFNTFSGNKYIATRTNVSIGTTWTKYIIPIPDASKLIEERGMFRYAAGTQGTNGSGYIFWIDELRFEKLGTLAQPLPKILNGVDVTEQTFIGSSKTLADLTQTFNGPNGQNITVNAAPKYFTFTSSDPSIATVNELGVVSIIGTGTTVITATIGGITAMGSLTLQSLGNFTSAPIPTRNPNDVKSIFSDTYTPATTINFDPQFGGSTTQTSQFTANNDSFLKYSNNNYTGIIFDNTVDASTLGFMHVDIYAQQAGVQIEFQIRDVGANGVLNTDVNTGFPIVDDKDYRQTVSGLNVNQWNSINIPLAGNIANQKNNLGAIIIVGGPNFILDNIYFYKVPTFPITPTVAAPTPTVPAANVISVFSDAYTNVASNLNPGWGQATVVSQVPIAGNNTLKYANLNYQGLEFTTSQNVSGMTHLHIDYYTTDSTLLKTYLISPGPVESPKNLTVPTGGAWISLEIPLTDFNPVNLANVIQMKFDGNGTIFLDNIYFHN
jgi:hypothetical protein